MHLLVVANETVTGRKLIEAVESHRGDDLRVTVIAPVNQPERGYVVYEDTRRAAAGRRLDRTVGMLRDEGIAAHGLVVETDPPRRIPVRRGEQMLAGKSADCAIVMPGLAGHKHCRITVDDDGTATIDHLGHIL